MQAYAAIDRERNEAKERGADKLAGFLDAVLSLIQLAIHVEGYKK